MTIEQKEQQFFSTEAKVLINSWQSIRNIIKEHTTLVKKQDATNDGSESPLLSDQQLNDAFNGPYQHFIKQKLSAYAKLGFLRLQLTIHQDDSLRSPHHNETKVIPTATLEKHSINDIDKMQSELDELTNNQHQQWQEQIKAWQQQLIMSLTAIDVPLNDLEIKELQDKEPLSELFDRFTVLNLEPIKLAKTDFDYEKYLRLKVNLAVYSSLSRRHQSHTENEIEEIIKKLKNDFDQINQQEKKLLEEQNAATLKIIDSIAAITNF